MSREETCKCRERRGTIFAFFIRTRLVKLDCVLNWEVSCVIHADL